MAIYNYTIGICYVTVRSLSVVGSSRVAYYLGRKDARGAEAAAWVAFFLSVTAASMQSVILLMFRKEIGLLFTTDEDVLELFGSSLAFVLAVYVIADGAQGGMTGVLGGMGKQGVAGPVAWLCYYMVALPISVLCSGVFGVGLSLQVLGLTIGILAGTWLHAGIYIYMVCRVDWEEQVQISVERLRLEIANHVSRMSLLPVLEKDAECDPCLPNPVEIELVGGDKAI
jgi:MATE family multidrug resistance protein